MINMTIGIIGCGNMGSALVKGIVSGGIVSSERVYAYDTEEKKVSILAAETNCQRGELSQMVRGSDILVIAVKPADFQGLAGKIAGDMAGQTLISVMAGVRIKDITRALGKEVAVIRAMPNLAAFVKKAMTCVAANGLVKKAEGEAAKAIFSGIGKVIEVEESYMDAVTAISGSGPAYLFYLAEAMMKSAKENGFTDEVSRTLVVETLYGAALILKEGSLSPSELIKKVASKKGTTEAALSVFEEKAFARTVAQAIDKARKRSEELSGGN